jgi:4-amino-4-deoxy-L-arabinose transferase-like glycosyltransferase
MFVAYLHSPLAGVFALDTLYYRTWALRIAGGDLQGTGVFEQSPLYAYLLAAVFRLCGPSEAWAMALQMLCGLLTVVLLYDTARRLFGERAALATGALTALYGPFLLHECLLMKSFLEPLFVSAALRAVVRHGEERRVRWALLAGLCLGLATQVREVHALLLAPAAFFLLRPGPPAARGRRSPAAVAALLVAFAGAILPTAARNYAVSGEVTLVTAAGGENLYLAYGPEGGAFYTFPPFISPAPHREHEGFREEASLRVGSPLDRGQASAFWYRQALQAVRENPWRAARLALGKVAVLFGDYEVPDSDHFDVARERLPFLRVLPTFAWVFGAGLIGLTGLLRTRRAGSPLVWFLAFLVLEIALTFNLARYRLALVALWMLPAGAGFAWLCDALRERRRGLRRAAAGGALLAVAAGCSLLGPGGSFPASRLADQERTRLDKATRRKAALAAAGAAADAEPWNPERLMALGALLRNLGMIPEGMAAYERILRDHPADGAARWELASTLVEQGRLAEAIEHLRILTVASPGDVRAHYFLGRFLARGVPGCDAVEARRCRAEAGEHFQAALRADPAHAPTWYEIGRLRYLEGSTGEAVRSLDRALQLAPGLDTAVRLREIIRRGRGENGAGPRPGRAPA